MSTERHDMPMPSASFSESRFWKHIGWIIAAKLLFITLLWWFCFGPGHRIAPDAALVQSHLMEGNSHAQPGR
jgi:hypothetical protein